MRGLRERRVQAGLSQSELARRSGIAQPNIAAYESGRRIPTASTRERLTAACRPRPAESLAQHRDEVVAVLARHRMSTPRVFGSVARGTDRPGSDLDLMVDAHADLDLLDLVDAASELEELLGVPVDIVTSRSLPPGHPIARSAVLV